MESCHPSQKKIESTSMNQTSLGQVNIQHNVLLFMAIAVPGYLNITIEKFATTFLVMPSALSAG